MPYFETDDTGPTLSSDRPQSELPDHLRLSSEKVNGNGILSSSYMPIKRSTVDGPEGFIDGGAVRAVESNGDVRHDTASSSAPNGTSTTSSWDRTHSSKGSDSVSSVSADATEVIESGMRSMEIESVVMRERQEGRSVASTNGYLRGPPNAELSNRAITTNGAIPSVQRLTVPSPGPAKSGNAAPGTPATSLLSPASAASPDTPSKTSSPHRLSSPPAYPAPNAPPPPPNTLPPPVPGQLKHRHTLQVPKVGSSRNSRDGHDDSVYASGRFSPTAVATGGRRGSLSLGRRNTRSIHSDMPHDEVLPDEDAMRWAEAVRQKRASKRKRKEDDDDDRVVVGTKVDQNHVNWVTAYNMLTGIRFTVSRTNAKLDRPLTDADFEAKHKFSFDITGNELTPSAKYDFKFKDYAPWVFRHLRAKFKLDPADYLMSLTSKYILSELGSPGKSGSFFYFSRDYKYIIKTIHHAEHKFLRKILREYYHHVEENPNTLLSQFYGLHRVKIPYGRKIHFVVMNNLFPPHRDIHQTFDLKGSTVGRDFKEEDLEKNPRATLKDLNWLRRDMHLEFGPEKKRLFVEQMEKDVKLLQRLKIMDYSMLVGIHDLKKGNQENLRDKTLKVFQPGGENAPTEDTDRFDRGPLMRTPSTLENARKARELRQIIKQEKPIPMGQSSSRMPDQMEENNMRKELLFYSDDGGFRATHEDNSPGDEIFFLSIIDCLTHYSMIKKLEHLWKGLSHDKKLISPIAPEAYGERFLRFIEGITMSPEEAARQKENAAANASQVDPQAPGNTSQDRSRGIPTQGSDVAQMNANEAWKTEKENSRNEPRTLKTARSPSAERSGGLQGQILPVVDEAGEASSTGGRSHQSRDNDHDREGRPLTPPKDNQEWRPVTPLKDNMPPSAQENGRKSLNRSSLDKDLPPLPFSMRAVGNSQ
ncbi:phosphatidylinositol-4-phosphate 5-kinase its3 [Xylogone sp. PMI_703]|nr:phosphatidylinositol-4-phosphate 5-kinase its3 [Xylogone sp. PMI_703]